MNHIVSVSGGLSSFEALRRTIEEQGHADTIALFADVKGNGYSHFFSQFPHLSFLLHEKFGGESPDLYRFLWQISYELDIPIHRISSDESIWTVFAKKRAMRLFTGNVFYCPASEKLKRLAIRDWIRENVIDRELNMVLGMGWDEEHRLKYANQWWSKALPEYNVTVSSPLMQIPFVENHHISDWLHKHGIAISETYAQNFKHDNCNRGCVHAGLAHWANLYNHEPEIYLYWAWMEWQVQQYLGKFVTIMKDQRGEGKSKPLSLYQFIERIERNDYPKLDWAGCGCFTNAEIAEAMSEPQPQQMLLAL